MPETFETPVGRIVWGNPAKSTQKRDLNTKQIEYKNGQPIEQWSFGIAFQKNEFIQSVKPYLDREAATLFPNGVPSNFSWKYKDGDGVDTSGKLYSSREGYAGCYVLNINTEAFAPPIYKYENSGFRQLKPEEIKTGDYVTVNLSIKANKPTNPLFSPSLYVNPNGVLFVAYGTEIVSAGQDPDEMFKNHQHQLPVGASATPINSAPSNVHPAYQQPTQQYQQPAAPAYQQPMQQYQQPAAPAYQQPMQPAGNVPGAQPMQPMQNYPTPAHDFVQNAGQPTQNTSSYPSNGMPGVPQGR